MRSTLDNPLYYLVNFERAMTWIAQRYADLLDDEERGFLARFSGLSQDGRALLVRLLMRKGPLFRMSKLVYPEIGDVQEAAQALAGLGWVEMQPPLEIDSLFQLLVKAEIARAFPGAGKTLRKAQQLEQLRPLHSQARCFHEWLPDSSDCVIALTISGVCERLRLMFFGNLHQDWTEFVLADLGILRYEQVDIPPESRGFGCRQDLEHYMQLHGCRGRLEEGETPQAVLAAVPPQALANPWLEGRRQKLLYLIGQRHERDGNLRDALEVYAGCAHEGARARQARVLEKCGEHGQAYALAASAWEQPENDAERQQLARMLPRLARKLAYPPPSTPVVPIDEFTLRLARPEPYSCVELTVRDHLHSAQAPVHYVENTLINSLFGLLCWQALFAAVPGAFFHPFHSAPADLHSAGFAQRRAREFDACLAQLDGAAWRETILRNYREKSGLQSPFVYWDAIGDDLLQQALSCLPPAHLRLWFRRLLEDIRANRAGMPDLIRFDPTAGSYQMIEVKGPGDRLQDNQLRWISFCAQHGMPVRVCHVRWLEAA